MLNIIDEYRRKRLSIIINFNKALITLIKCQRYKNIALMNIAGKDCR